MFSKLVMEVRHEFHRGWKAQQPLGFWLNGNDNDESQNSSYNESIHSVFDAHIKDVKSLKLTNKKYSREMWFLFDKGT